MCINNNFLIGLGSTQEFVMSNSSSVKKHQSNVSAQHENGWEDDVLSKSSGKKPRKTVKSKISANTLAKVTKVILK